MIPTQRMSDSWGSGWFGAPRGKRKHGGVDLGAYPGLPIISVCAGVFTKFGFPYSQDENAKKDMSKSEVKKFNFKKALRYVQITNDDGLDFRYFYVISEFSLKIGARVETGDVIGHAQGLSNIYPGITDHIHFEIKKDGVYLNPADFCSEVGR